MCMCVCLLCFQRICFCLSCLRNSSVQCPNPVHDSVCSPVDCLAQDDGCELSVKCAFRCVRPHGCVGFWDHTAGTVLSGGKRARH